MVTRIAQRLGLKEERIWARLQELRAAGTREPANKTNQQDSDEEPKARAHPVELDLLRVLLADPALVPVAQAEVDPRMIEHPRLRLLLETLFRLQAEGEVPDLDHARMRIDNPVLVSKALELQQMGRSHGDRPVWLRRVLECLRERQDRPARIEIQNQLRAVNSDDPKGLELLRQLQGSGVRSQGSVKALNAHSPDA